MLLVSMPAMALDPNALPTQGQVAAGAGSINTSGNQMTVNQSSQNMVVNWQTFNIGQNASVNFQQPNAQSSALNRVFAQDASQIYGSLTSNGRVFLVNPNGVIFGSSASVNVGAMVASTLNIRDSDFMSGRYAFEKAGTAGSVVNLGTINAADGGFVALLAPEVVNQGLITARLGSVGLMAGDKVTMDVRGDGLINFAIEQSAVNALAENRGLIRADGGQVILGARHAGDLMATVVNNTGVIEAASMVERNGVIVLDGGSEGVVSNSGTLSAIGAAAGQTGGQIKALGDKVGLMAGSIINISGDAGAGEVLIGGNYQGRGAEQNATATYVDATASIYANAGSTGNGGKVIVWSDETTRFYGNIEARGGALTGNGGLVETSGKQFLDFQGQVDTRATNGATGTLLLDPYDVTISTGSNSNINSTGSPFSPTGDSAILNVTNLTNQLANTNVEVNTGSGGAQVGNITVATAVSWNSANSLTLTAAPNTGAVNINAAVTASGSGGFTATGRNVDVNANISTQGGDIALAGNSYSTGNFAGAGVSINGAYTVSTQSGNITISGKGGNGGVGDGNYVGGQHGVEIMGGANISAGGSGNLTITGIGGGQNVANPGTENNGVMISGNGLSNAYTQLTANGGLITITGSKGYQQAISFKATELATNTRIVNSTGTVRFVNLNGPTNQALGSGTPTDSGSTIQADTLVFDGEFNFAGKNRVSKLAGNASVSFFLDNGGNTGNGTTNLIIGNYGGFNGISTNLVGDRAFKIVNVDSLDVQRSIIGSSSGGNGNVVLNVNQINFTGAATIGNGTNAYNKIDISTGFVNGTARLIELGVSSSSGNNMFVDQSRLDSLFAARTKFSTDGDINVAGNFLIDSGNHPSNTVLELSANNILNNGDYFIGFSQDLGQQVTLNATNIGGAAGTSNEFINTQGATNLEINAGNVFNVRSYRADNSAQLTDLDSLTINSDSSGGNTTYQVQAQNLTFVNTGNGSAYNALNVNDTTGLTFSYTGNSNIYLNESSNVNGNTPGRSFSVTSDGGGTDVILAANKQIVSGDTALFSASGNILLDTGSSIVATGNVVFTTAAGGTDSFSANGNTSVTAGAGKGIVFNADTVNLNASSQFITTGEALFLTIDPSRNVSLGSEQVGNLSLTDSELSTFSVDRIHIGRGWNNIYAPRTGNITITGNVDLTGNTNTLLLESTSGNVSQTAGNNVKVSTLSVDTRLGTINLPGSNDVDNFSATTWGRNITFNSISDLTIGSAGGVNAVGSLGNTSTSAGNIAISSSGNLVISNQVNSYGLDNGQSPGLGGNISLTGASVNISANVSASGGKGYNDAANAGNISVVATSGNVILTSSGRLLASGGGGLPNAANGGDGGNISISGGNLTLAGTIDASGGNAFAETWISTGWVGGNAGSVNLTASTGSTILNGATINIVGGNAAGNIAGNTVGQIASNGNGGSLTFSGGVTINAGTTTLVTRGGNAAAYGNLLGVAGDISFG